MLPTGSLEPLASNWTGVFGAASPKLNEAIGLFGRTATSFEISSAEPALSMTWRVTAKVVPVLDAAKAWVGFVSVEVVPSPKFQKYDKLASFVVDEVLVNVTSWPSIGAGGSYVNDACAPATCSNAPMSHGVERVSPRWSIGRHPEGTAPMAGL